MGKIKKITTLALSSAFMSAFTTSVAAQNITSPPPGTSLTIYGVLDNIPFFGWGPKMPGAGGPSNPGCPLILVGEVASASPGIIRVDTVYSCMEFTLPMFIRFTSPYSGTIDRLEATEMSIIDPSEKCGSDNVFFTWSNPRHLNVPPTYGDTPTDNQVCHFKIEFTFSPDIYVQ